MPFPGAGGSRFCFLDSFFYSLGWEDVIVSGCKSISIMIFKLTADGQRVLYVGRTGDTSSPNAQSPFNRLSQHLGTNAKSNALRRHLLRNGIAPEDCHSFLLVPYGPIFAEGQTAGEHVRARNIVAALEKALADAMTSAGYRVLNEVKCQESVDAELLDTVLAAFAAHFPALQTVGNGRNSG